MKERQFQIEDVLPRNLLARLHGSEGSRPAAIEFPAAVMFVDVSRYTALVEQFARRGREGLGDLPNLLNLSYSRCSEHVTDLGGEVLYFAGDSLIAYWVAESDEELGPAVRSAVACAELVCRGGNDGKNYKFGDIAPALHVGIGAGRLWAAALGENSVWNLIAGGAAIAQAAAAQALARSWTYEMSVEARLVLAQARASPATPFRHLSTNELKAPPPNWMASFLPAQVRELLARPNLMPLAARGELAAADVDWSQHIDTEPGTLNEIRPISALFARVIGLDCVDPPDLLQYQRLCMALQGIVRARGGPPGNLFYDDKGLIFSVLFGARGNFHRDDARRAVDAAHAINEAIEQLGLSCSIGVATGDALFAFVGSTRRCQLMAHGAPINRAARLMMAHDQGILCDAPTERASRTGFRFEPKGTLQLAGLGNMAAVFLPGEPCATTSTDGLLVGRRSELEMLDRAFEDARSGGKRLVVVMGESGIGKSALVGSFATKLRSNGVAVAIARAERDDRRTSLLPWRRLLAALLHLPQDSDGPAVLTALASVLGPGQSILERLPLLDGVLGTEIPENENTRHLQGAHRGDATMRLVGELFEAVAAHPLVLILEDSHWLDSASWRLAEWILATHSSVLILLCVRSEEIPDELRSLLRRAEAARTAPSGVDLDDPARFCRVLPIEELSDSEIRELAALRLGAAPPERELADRICELAGGNPLFTEEIALTLRAEGLVAIRDGAWRSIRPLDELRYFEGVERLIRERTDRLETGVLDVLKAAAVTGRAFSSNALAVVLKDRTRDEIRQALEFLVSGHFIRKCAIDDVFEFRHDQIREVVYASIPAEVRHALHGTLAEWLEKTGEASTRAEIATLAQHFEAAGKSDKAVAYAEIAATRALQVGAFREVEALLGICFNHESRQSTSTPALRLRSVRWRIQLAEAQYCRGDIHAQGIAVRRALTLAGEPMPRSTPTIAVRIATSSLWLLAQQLLPATALSPRAELGQAWEREMSRCHSQAAMVDYFELRFLETFRHLIAAVIHAQRTGLTRELAVAASNLASGLGLLGYQRFCEHFIKRAEHAAVALGDPAIHAHVCSLDALWRVGECQWPAVDYRLKQSQELSLQAGDQLRWCNAQVIRFWSLFYRGDLGSLEQTANGLLSRAQSSGNIQQEIWALRCKSLCALHADRPREAIEILRHITSAMHGTADIGAYVSSKGVLALALARTGLKDESLEAVDETLRMLREMRRPTAHSTLVGISGVCEVLLRGQETSQSREYDQWPQWQAQALHELKRYSDAFPVGRAQYGLWSGVAYWLDGRTDRALQTWRQALSVAQRLALRQDEATIAAEIRRRQDRV